MTSSLSALFLGVLHQFRPDSGQRRCTSRLAGAQKVTVLKSPVPTSWLFRNFLSSLLRFLIEPGTWLAPSLVPAESCWVIKKTWRGHGPLPGWRLGRWAEGKGSFGQFFSSSFLERMGDPEDTRSHLLLRFQPPFAPLFVFFGSSLASDLRRHRRLVRRGRGDRSCGDVSCSHPEWLVAARSVVFAIFAAHDNKSLAPIFREVTTQAMTEYHSRRACRATHLLKLLP